MAETVKDIIDAAERRLTDLGATFIMAVENPDTHVYYFKMDGDLNTLIILNERFKHAIIRGLDFEGPTDSDMIELVKDGKGGNKDDPSYT